MQRRGHIALGSRGWYAEYLRRCLARGKHIGLHDQECNAVHDNSLSSIHADTKTHFPCGAYMERAGL